MADLAKLIYQPRGLIETMANESVSTANDNEIYKQLETYPWATDREFQGGLSAILGPNPSPSQIRDLTLRAQCFYLSRKKSVPIDFDGYKAYLATKQNGNLSNSTNGSSLTNSSPRSQALSSGDDQPPPPPPHNHPSNHETDTADPKTAPYPPTFAQIVELITSGAPIPGIKDIPDTVLTGQGSKPTAPKRKKPWETELPDETEGTFGDERDHYIQQELPDA